MEDRRCKLGLRGRLELVELIASGQTFRAAAAALNVSPATAHRWWRRWQSASDDSAPNRSIARLTLGRIGWTLRRAYDVQRSNRFAPRRLPGSRQRGAPGVDFRAGPRCGRHSDGLFSLAR
jgi:helix-turn-helix protein